MEKKGYTDFSLGCDFKFIYLIFGPALPCHQWLSVRVSNWYWCASIKTIWDSFIIQILEPKFFLVMSRVSVKYMWELIVNCSSQSVFQSSFTSHRERPRTKQTTEDHGANYSWIQCIWTWQKASQDSAMHLLC